MIVRPLSIAALALLVSCAATFADETPGPPVTMAVFGDRECNPDQTCGDTWDSAWLADDRVLVQYNDGNGFSLPHANVHHDGICELLGTPADISTIRGIDLNPGRLGHFLGATYSTGIYEVDGALYHPICRSIQIPGKWKFYDTCLYKSTDGGATWLNHLGQKDTYIPASLPAATFPDRRWGQVNFVKYGRGGVAPGIDRAREFVYLIAPSFGLNTWMARIRRADLKAWTGAFDRSRIEYYRGQPNADGRLDANWTRDIGRATSIFSGRPLRSVVWNPGLRRYVATSIFGDSWENPPIPSSVYVYDAPHPWGPWTEVGAEFIEPRVGDDLSWLFLLQPFMSADGTTMWATVAGRKPYGLQFIPITLTTQPVATRYAAQAERSGTTLANTSDVLGIAWIDGFRKIGDGCTFTLPIKEPGLYALRYRYQCDKPNQTLTLTVNDQPDASLKLGNTFASRSPWNEGAARLHLEPGTARIQFHLTAGDTPNEHLLLDRIQLALLPASAKN